METRSLSQEELVGFVHATFAPKPGEKMTLLTDLPTPKNPDDPIWKWRIATVVEWWRKLNMRLNDLGLSAVDLYFYRSTGVDGADLPNMFWKYTGGKIPRHSKQIKGLTPVALNEVLAGYQILLTPTQFSTTPPLKSVAKAYGFRAGTMPDMSPAVLDVLMLDMSETSRRVHILADLLKDSIGADIVFGVGRRSYRLHLDLDCRYPAHASTGQLHEPGMVGNVPSAEAYRVPFDGCRRRAAEGPSTTVGILPIQHGKQVMLFRVEKNRIVETLTRDPASLAFMRRIKEVWAYGNIAELGLGVWRETLPKPIAPDFFKDETLAEKLGLHVATGKSGHFGGGVGSKAFRRGRKHFPAEHFDHIYVFEKQPLIHVVKITLTLRDGSVVTIMVKDKYVAELFTPAALAKAG